MAAYAALISLMTTLKNIQIHPQISTFFDHQQIQSLHQIINFLIDFMETSNSHGAEEEEDLERRIASTAHRAEYAIESLVLKQILSDAPHENLQEKNKSEATNLIGKFRRQLNIQALLDLETEIKDMDSVKETVTEFRGKIKFKDEQSNSRAASKPTTAKKECMVGFEEKLIQIMDRLTTHQPDLQVVSIVGMGGIGKTTLAKAVYHNLFIVESFDLRAWATVTQEYSVKHVLSQLLSCIGGALDCQTDLEREDHELGLKLYQTLLGRRYLIVLDDTWSLDAWDEIKCFFPNIYDRSRVVITTRISSVATHLSSSSIEMDFLDEDQSWELFCANVFPEKGCPPELEEIGTKIVRECKGLPLSIVIIGGLLRNSTSTREYWENLARDLNSILMSDAHCMNILSLSYKHLPAHLKPCFLYMGVFEEDERIRVSLLINLLVVEGILKSKEDQTLEEVAEDYLNDLVDRNLILVDGWKWGGKIKYCKMHDLVREVCLMIGSKERNFHSMRKLSTAHLTRNWRHIMIDEWYDSNPFPTVFKQFLPSAKRAQVYARICSHRRSAHKRILLSASHVPLPFACYGPLLLQLQMVRVLNSVEFVSLDNFRHVILRCHSGGLVHMMSESRFPSSVSLFWNVHTLIFSGRLEAAPEIWYMRQLKRLHFTSIFLPDPPPTDDVLLPNLHTLSTVVDFSFTEQVCKKIPNIKKLGIACYKHWEFPKECCYYLNHLHKLESLFCSFGVPKRDDLLQGLVFPNSLRKLSLNDCGLQWEELNRFGLSLPHLQVLNLYKDAVVGPEWECIEGAFPCLKFLLINSNYLIKWAADSCDFFPVLEKLRLGFLHELENIPSGIGEIHTLESLRLYYCSLCASVSSTEILEEQMSLGNEDLQVEVSLRSEEANSFIEKVGLMCFMSKNFKLYSFRDAEAIQTKKNKTSWWDVDRTAWWSAEIRHRSGELR